MGRGAYWLAAVAVTVCLAVRVFADEAPGAGQRPPEPNSANVNPSFTVGADGTFQVPQPGTTGHPLYPPQMPGYMRSPQHQHYSGYPTQGPPPPGFEPPPVPPSPRPPRAQAPPTHHEHGFKQQQQQQQQQQQHFEQYYGANGHQPNSHQQQLLQQQIMAAQYHQQQALAQAQDVRMSRAYGYPPYAPQPTYPQFGYGSPGHPAGYPPSPQHGAAHAAQTHAAQAHAAQAQQEDEMAKFDAQMGDISASAASELVSDYINYFIHELNLRHKFIEGVIRRLSRPGMKTSAAKKRKHRLWLLYQLSNLIENEKEILSHVAEEELKETGPTYVITGRFLKGQLGVVHEVFQDLGYKEHTGPLNKWGWNVAWGTGGSLPKDYYPDMQVYQRFNHFPCTGEIGTKHRLFKNLVKASKRAKRLASSKDIEDGSAFDFFAHSYLLPDNLEELKADLKKNESMFILKPKAGARGENIQMLTSADDIPKEKMSKFIAQQYIANPLLVKNKKHTLRLYVAVTSFQPMRIYLMNNGFVHLATEDYTTDPSRLSELRVHVTNPDVQGDDFQKTGGGDLYWNLTRFRNMLAEHETLDVNKVWQEIERVVVYTVMAVEPAIFKCLKDYDANRDGSFEVWGFDVMVDDTGKVWLIEVNHTPSTNTDFAASKQIKYDLIHDLLQMVTVPDDVFSATRLEVGTEVKRLNWTVSSDDMDALAHAQAEMSIAAKGNYELLYPSPTRQFPGRMIKPDRIDDLLQRWVARDST